MTSAEIVRLEKFLIDVKNDLKCAETRCSDRYFRPSLEATADPPFHGLNKEVVNLKKNIETIESHLDALKYLFPPPPPLIIIIINYFPLDFYLFFIFFLYFQNVPYEIGNGLSQITIRMRC